VIKKLPPFPALSESQENNIEYLTFDEQKKVIEAIPEVTGLYLCSVWNSACGSEKFGTEKRLY